MFPLAHTNFAADPGASGPARLIDPGLTARGPAELGLRDYPDSRKGVDTDLMPWPILSRVSETCLSRALPLRSDADSAPRWPTCSSPKQARGSPSHIFAAAPPLPRISSARCVDSPILTRPPRNQVWRVVSAETSLQLRPDAPAAPRYIRY